MGSRKVIYVIVIFLLVISIVSVPGGVGEEECQTCKYKGCERCVWEGSDEYCIFHDPDPNKNRDVFLDELQSFLNDQKEKEIGIYDLSGFVFPRNITTNFPSPQHSYRFDKRVYFENTVFWGKADFENITFESGADFSGTIVKGYTGFRNVDFNGTTNFNDVIFEGKVIFLNVTFEGDASFKKTIFKDEVSFSGVRFQKNVYFDGAVFEKRVSFYSSGGIGEEQTVFGGEGDQESKVSFTNTEFYEQTTFNDCVFNVEVDFIGTKFIGDTEFIVGEFKKHTTFSNAVFEGDVDFVGMTFGSEIHFPEVKFNGDTRFFDSYFNSGVNFDSSRFRGDLELKTKRLEKSLSLVSVRIEKALILEIGKENAEFIDLKDLRVYGYGMVTANLEQTYFKDAFLKNINFIECDWPEDYVVHEENNKKKLNLNYADLEFIYRNLKNSFQNYGDNEMASHFFYREMEMKRKGTSLIKDPIKCGLLHILYGVCGYGEKLSWLLIWSFIVIFGFAGLFYFTGIEIKNYLRIVHSNRILCRIYEASSSSKETISYFFFSLFLSITSFSTLGSNYVKSKGKWTYRFSALESLIGAFFIALFIYVFVRKMLR